jgi:acetone carboxylase gamma subunit
VFWKTASTSIEENISKDFSTSYNSQQHWNQISSYIIHDCTSLMDSEAIGLG